MRTVSRLYFSVLLFALAAGLTPVAGPTPLAGGVPQAAGPAASQGTSPPAGLELILLKPSIRFEDMPKALVWEEGVHAEGRQTTAGGLEEYEEVLLVAAKQALAGKVTLLDMSMLIPSVADACGRLEPLAPRLARGHVNEEATDGLSRLAALDERYAVLVQFLRIETGPGRSWNATTGQITSSSASTLIQAALLSGKTAKVLWRGERLVRYKALKPADPGFRKTLADLYQDFQIQEGGLK